MFHCYLVSFLHHYYKKLLKGISAFWKGAVPTAMGMVLENAMAFGVNEALKRTFPDDAKEDPTKRPDLLRPFMMVRNYHTTLDCFGSD